jgi:hypothetical protein
MYFKENTQWKNEILYWCLPLKCDISYRLIFFTINFLYFHYCKYQMQHNYHIHNRISFEHLIIKIQVTHDLCYQK